MDIVINLISHLLGDLLFHTREVVRVVLAVLALLPFTRSLGTEELKFDEMCLNLGNDLYEHACDFSKLN